MVTLAWPAPHSRPDSAGPALRTAGAWVHRRRLQAGSTAGFFCLELEGPALERPEQEARRHLWTQQEGQRWPACSAQIPRLPRQRNNCKKRQCFLPLSLRECVGQGGRRVLQLSAEDTGMAAFYSTGPSPLGPQRKISPLPRVSRQRVGWLRRNRSHTQEERAMDHFNFN